ncbi:hypothetical protein A1L58_16695 [Shewanella baltica]|uniref:hypothetical protein n=1 Tax=Shewanella baltica TaxID=62322 RepID=UPI0007B49C64|nr:hypothetical protein [Shewanella baltica]KZK69134.1 hypothetical protein A1L58_16695 [Shewanella baltica]
MNLDFVRNESQEYSKLTSTNARNYALAGIAVVWILSSKNASDALNYFALWCFGFALFMDLLQYSLGAVMWAVFDSYKQNKLKEQFESNAEKVEAEDFEAPFWMNWPTMACFVLKPIAVLVGFAHLLHSIMPQQTPL